MYTLAYALSDRPPSSIGKSHCRKLSGSYWLYVCVLAVCVCICLLDCTDGNHATNAVHLCVLHASVVPDAATMQVWWYIAGAVGGNLYKHDLACDSVVELEDARKEPPVSAMHHDAQGHVWVGHKGGMVRVWSERDLTPVTLPIKCFHAEIR